jgi:iron complex outermembrane receptor protein
MNRTFLAVFFLLTTPLFADTLRGTVKDATGAPLPGAAVSTGNSRAITDTEGAFALDVPAGTYDVRVSHPGFQSVKRSASTSEPLEVTLDAAFSETMVVSAIRADEGVPVTKTDLGRADIERQYHGQDIPLLLRDTPSVNAWAESGGGGAGYSYISLRGVSPTRINFTLDGVPLSDSEDMGTYFVDFPDLARSLESIQIQRGVGTSTFGTAAFAGSVNMESLSLAQDSRTQATLGAGSFGNRQASVGYQTGALANGFAFYTRLSYLESDGFRDNSATKQHNLFFSGSKQLGDAQLKLTGFSGHEQQQLSFYATDAATLETDLRNNPLRPEERDSFGYDLGQLQYIRPLGDASDLTASVYYQRGYGWYRLFDYGTDDLRQYGLDGMLIGSILTFSHRSGAFTTNYGVHVNRFRRDHTRDAVAAGTRDYANYGTKGELNAFAKTSYDAGRWHLYGDAQLRHSTFDYHGDVAIPGIAWTFFNPKTGVRFDVTRASSVYASAGISTREPTRNDLFLGEDNASVAHDLHAVRPERVVDVEAGWNLRRGNVELAANVYSMSFHNEIAATGELSDIGLALRRNVDRSSRRGIELDAAWQATSQVRFKTTASLSRNRIAAWTQFFDVYDAEGNWSGSRAVTYKNIQPLLTPSTIVSQSIDYTPGSRFTSSVTGRYVGRSYLDNTNNDALATPSFTLVDAKASYAVTPWARLTLQVGNLLDAKRVYGSGYSYLYYDGDVQSGTAYYYPQATRNASLLLDLDF